MRLQYALIGAATLFANTDIVSANTNFAPTTSSTTTRAIDTGLVFDAFNGKRYLRISKPIDEEANGGEPEERLPVISFYKDQVTAKDLIKKLFQYQTTWIRRSVRRQSYC
ncbi:RxLR effector protein [Phytophthora megakarya]|uniref:RxLR effector protein n=1 Tax=Phytophthora megakarya TaxID=4795 RepID=A0A225WB81_9STRA|nr:RxLR effector protein [Phytophthora megakarya]